MQDLIINYRHHIKQRSSETVFRLSDDLLSNDAKYHLVNLACASAPHLQVLGRLRLVSFVYFYNCRNFQ
ncbi:hypothetical protein HMPREF3156_01237 [Neisseria sp. HMSC06F02]|nr:hypothetical protein HMPREF3156_01237 [Neisseria sp. HMSC06F02]